MIGAEDPAYEAAKHRALRFLSYRPRSVHELRVKLREKGSDEPTIAKVIDRFSELRYLDDDSVARQWARSYAVGRLWGNRKIEAKLRERGLATDTINRAIAEAREEISEGEAIRKIMERRFPHRLTSEGISDKEQQRLVRHLLGKGFPSALVFEVLATPGKEEYGDNG